MKCVHGVPIKKFCARCPVVVGVDLASGQDANAARCGNGDPCSYPDECPEAGECLRYMRDQRSHGEQR